MQAGPLRHRIWLQRPTNVRTGSGAFDEVYTDWLQVWASVEPLTPREIFAAQQVLSELTTRIRIRYRPGMDAKMRVRHQRETGSPSINDFYDIEGPPVQIDGKRIELVLYCKRRDAEGFRTGDPYGQQGPAPGDGRIGVLTEEGDNVLTEEGDRVVTEEST